MIVSPRRNRNLLYTELMELMERWTGYEPNVVCTCRTVEEKVAAVVHLMLKKQFATLKDGNQNFGVLFQNMLKVQLLGVVVDLKFVIQQAIRDVEPLVLGRFLLV